MQLTESDESRSDEGGGTCLQRLESLDSPCRGSRCHGLLGGCDERGRFGECLESLGDKVTGFESLQQTQGVDRPAVTKGRLCLFADPPDPLVLAFKHSRACSCQRLDERPSRRVARAE